WNRALSSGFLPDSSLRQTYTTRLDHYGLGWIIDTAYGKQVAMDEGATFGFVSFIGRIPADQSCIILFDNHSASGIARIAEIINAIINDQPYEFPRYRKEMNLDSGTLRQYEGEYQFAPNFSITIKSVDGHLLVQATGQGPIEFFAQSPDFFFTKIVEMQMEFIRDANRKITRLNLYQGGQQVQGKKIN
ncbi:MAG TPA: DUF3471 domain-containing protein, partial [Puia sp.]|nr:DUF3471 domain-containing protein [Puia sp.]